MFRTYMDAALEEAADAQLVAPLELDELREHDPRGSIESRSLCTPPAVTVGCRAKMFSLKD